MMIRQRIPVAFRRLAFVTFVIALSVTGASAQSTVFNIPSTDVQSPGKAYLEGDFMIHFGSLREGGYQEYGARLVVGLPGNMEVGINGFHVRAESRNRSNFSQISNGSFIRTKKLAWLSPPEF